MNFLFKNKPKGPAEIVRSLKESILKLENPESNKYKANEEISKCISSIVTIFQENPTDKKNQDGNSEMAVQISQEIFQNDIFSILIPNLYRIPFETKKEIAMIYGILLRRKVGAREPTVEYLSKNGDIIRNLIKGYERPESAVFCGTMIRESLKHESLVDIMLNSKEFFGFFEYSEAQNFDLASDAFANFRDILLRFKPRVAKFLMDNYDMFFEKYTKLLNSKNYVIRRQSLKLLGEILLERKNFNIMAKYISSSENLKLIMMALADKSKSIQYEAFHIFKIFVANPNKTAQVYEILKKNRDKLVEFLGGFQVDKDTDEQFKDEKAFLIKELHKINHRVVY